MSKDPAVLFYTGDFLVGISLLTDEQAGQYIKLLCLQHQSGHIPKYHMLNICKSYDNPVFSKFTKDTDGLYYNVRMDEEIEKRINFCNSRASNRKGHTKDNKICKSYVKHMDNENDNDNINIIVDEIYKLYPSKSKGRDRITKCLKDKEKIAKILKTDYPLRLAVEIAGTLEYPKDLATFLNHLPDPDTLIPKSNIRSLD